MKNIKTAKTALSGSVLLLATLSGNAFASGFQLLEQNASGMGVAYAGSAAVAEDASTVFFNPAGMAWLEKGKVHFSVGLAAIQPSAKFSDSGTYLPNTTWSKGGNGGDAGSLAWLPDAYVVVPINEKISFGLGMGAPFGLKTEYDSNWMGRFLGVKSDIKTINLNPSLSYKLNDTVSLGFGLDYQRLSGEFTGAANYLGYKEGQDVINASDTAWGYNLGAIIQVTPATRLGIAYRSTIKYRLEGNADFSRNGDPLLIAALPGTIAQGGAMYSDIKLPDTLILSGQHRLSDQWDLLADLSWTGWSKIPKLEFVYTNNNQPFNNTPEFQRDTLRLAVGGVYKYNNALKLRTGLAFDKSPVDALHRTPRLPDNNRTWLSFGGQYKLGQSSAIDIGYTHIFIKDSTISDDGGTYNKSIGINAGKLQGTYSNKVDMLGAQYSQSF